jgi:hypothetical protein
MWELLKASPFGRISQRTGFLFAAIFLMASLLVSIFPSGTAYAADASWQNSQITYGGNQYIRFGTAQENESHGLPKDTTIFAYTEPDISGSSNPTRKAHLIYFAPGTDPTTATSASYQTFDFTPPNTFIKTGSSPISITVDPSSATSTAATETTCDIPHGTGWIICPVTRTLANAMDFIYGVISSFLEVRPLQTTQDATLYKAWSYMRNFANVAFVIGFLIIIYSQVTGLGVSAYGIKKVLPRIVIAAILVNISYWLCALAVDVSNILGASFQNIFTELRAGLSNNPNWSNMQVSWTELTAFLLSGVGGALFGTWLIVSGPTITGAALMLVPVLLSVVLAALVALVVLALRQGLIIILIVVSPLAAVAYLLPNTESYAKKWGNLFQTMLVLFPIFSIIFGGSQLAGLLIIQNANNIIMVILGMAVQVAPLFVTPLIVKFSGSLLGRIAGMINNPNKGLIDRTRNWAKDRADVHRAKVQARPLTGKMGAMRRRFGAAGRENGRRKREWQKKNYTTMGEGNWLGTDVARGLREAEEYANTHKSTQEAIAEAAVNRMRTTNGHRLQIGDIQMRLAKLDVDVTKTETDAQFENLRAPASALNTLPTQFANEAQQARALTLGAAVVARQVQSAQMLQQRDITAQFESDGALRQRAGGIDPAGAQRALANALSAQHKARGEIIDNANAIIEHANLVDTQIVQLARGVPQAGIDASADVREAAIRKIASGGNVAAINELLETLDLSPASDPNLRIALTEGLKKNGARPKYVGFAKMGEINQGIPGGVGTAGIDDMIRATIAGGKLSAEAILGQEQDALVRVAEAIRRNRASYSQAELDGLGAQIREIYANNVLRPRVGERDAALKDILGQI